MGLFDFFTNRRKKSVAKIKPSTMQINQVQVLMRQLQESIEIVNTTTSPRTFWSRLNFSLDILLELKKYEKYDLFRNSTPTNDYNKIIGNLEATVNAFVDRVIISQSEKNDLLSSQQEKDKRMKKCVENLWHSFYESADYWQGNGVYPHFTGKLFTDSNFQRVDDIFKDLVLKEIEKSVAKEKADKPKQKAISTHEKELLLVRRITTNDMQDVPNMPFVINCDVQKFIREGGHPFAYMDIVGENICNVKCELSKINQIITRDSKNNARIPKNARIPIEQIVFQPSDMYGYTRIMCTPKTLTGKLSKYPYTLFFATDLSKTTTGGDTTHGELVYDQQGRISKANIYCWRKGKGYFLYYKTINGVLTLYNFDKSSAG